MSVKKEYLDNLQKELARAFEWMERATANARKGCFNSACFDMTIALQYWQNCQHYEDIYIDCESADEVNWKLFTTMALAMARKELEDEGE